MRITMKAPASATPQKIATDQPAPVDQLVAASILELDLEVARAQSRLIGRRAGITAQRRELAATKRANRSTLNEIAASLGVSRSTANRMFDEPPTRGGGKQDERVDRLRHAHGVGRRRHAGAGVRRGGPFHG